MRYKMDFFCSSWCLKDIYVKGAGIERFYIRNTCFCNTCPENTCIKVAGIGNIYIKDASIVKQLRIYL